MSIVLALALGISLGFILSELRNIHATKRDAYIALRMREVARLEEYEPELIAVNAQVECATETTMVN